MTTAAGVHKLRQPATGVITNEIHKISTSSLRPGQEARINGVTMDNSAYDTEYGRLGKKFVRPKDEHDEDLLKDAIAEIEAAKGAK